MSVVTKRRALLALLLLVPVPSIGAAMAMWIAPGAVGKAVYFCGKTWIVVLPALWLIWVEKGRPSWSKPTGRGMLVGLAWGIAIAAGILVAYRLLAFGRIDTAALHEIAVKNRFATPAMYLAFAAYLTLVNSLVEEYVWRWFVQSRCGMLMRPGAAIGSAALFFTLHHVIALRAYLGWGATLTASAGVFIGGVLWGWMYQRYRSVWPGFISHALVDAAIFTIGWSLLFADGVG